MNFTKPFREVSKSLLLGPKFRAWASTFWGCGLGVSTVPRCDPPQQKQEFPGRRRNWRQGAWRGRGSLGGPPPPGPVKSVGAPTCPRYVARMLPSALSAGEAPWKTLSAEELEKQYSPSKWVIRMKAEEVVSAFVQIGSQATLKARATRRNQLDVPYGHGEGEKMDIYFPDEDSKAFPLFLFLHGGYWQSGSKDDSAFMVNSLTAQGVAVVIVAYDIAPKGTLDQMVDQVTRSVVFLQKRYPSNEGIYVCGHSAGAHLAAMVLLTSWTKHGVTPNLQGFFLVSGIYSLEPLISTSQNAPLHMTLEDAQRNSPQRHLEVAPARPVGPACPVLVLLGQHDSPEFHRQSREFYETLCQAGWTASFQQLHGVDHFDIIENLTQEDDVLTQIILKTIFQTL